MMTGVTRHACYLLHRSGSLSGYTSPRTRTQWRMLSWLYRPNDICFDRLQRI